jgi:tetratricopeptide (TPR) repeat protein
LKRTSGRTIRRGTALLLLCLAGAAFADSSVEKGRAAYNDGLYEIAERHLRRAVRDARREERREEARLLLGWSLRESGRPEEALELLREHPAPDAEPSLERLALEAQALADLGRVEAGLARLEGAEARRAGERALRAVAETEARLLLALGRAEEALDRIDRYFERDLRGSERAGLLLEWSRAAVRHGRPDRARRWLIELLEANPADATAGPARLLFARILAEEEDWQPAEEMLAGLRERPDADPILRAEASFLLGRLFHDTGREERALELLAEALAAEAPAPVRARARLLRGWIRIRSGDEEAGAEEMREAVRDLSDDPFAAGIQLDLARRLLDQDRPADALREYQVFLEVFDVPARRGEALFGKGAALEALGRPQEAAASFEKAVEALEGEAALRALARAADANFAAGQLGAAGEQYGRLAQDASGETAFRAALQQAECLERQGEVEEALRILDRVRAGESEPRAALARLKRAAIEERRRRWEEAEASYGRLLEEAEDVDLRATARLRRGLLRYRLGLFDEALEDFQAVVKADRAGRELEQAFFMRGWCRMMLGEDEAALALGREFIERFPQSPWTEEVLFWLGETHFNRSVYPAAEERFLQIADVHPESELADDALFWAARAAFREKEYLRAVEHLNRLARDFPDSEKMPEARFAQGDALSELGQFPAAILAFDKVVHDYPDSYLADRAWGRMGDCHFTLGADNPERYKEAVTCYEQVLNSETAPEALKLQAETKIGRCREKAGDPEAAFEHYMNVVYHHVAARREGMPGDPVWFTRAAFGAAQIAERNNRWREAAGIYRRVVDAGVVAAPEAQKRLQKLRLDHWMLF